MNANTTGQDDGMRLLRLIAKIGGLIFGGFSLFIVILLAVVLLIASAASGAVTDQTSVGDTASDVYYISVAEVQQELNIQNSINVNVVKSSVSLSGNYTTDSAVIKQFIKDNFVRTTESVGADGQTSAVYAFLTETELRERFKTEPFNFDGAKIDQIFELALQNMSAAAQLGGQLAFPFQAEYYISCSYGQQPNRFHGGIDLSCVGAMGKPIYAAESGTVTLSQSKESYGNSILISHSLQLQTRYAHLSSFAVSNGDAVARGQLIGFCGSTGNSTGPHLHFEVLLNGRTVDPTPYIFGN